MSQQHVTRTECDRCGHIWEGQEPGSGDIILRKGHTKILGQAATIGMWTCNTYGHLCANCMSALVPWLSQK